VIEEIVSIGDNKLSRGTQREKKRAVEGEKEIIREKQNTYKTKNLKK
jgi:hypothetical protein